MGNKNPASPLYFAPPTLIRINTQEKKWVNVCLAWLRKRRSGRLLSTPTAGPFVAEEADRDRQVLVHCRHMKVKQVWVFRGGSSLSFRSSSVVCLWGSLSGSLQTVKQPCGLCGARRLYISGHVRPLLAVYVTHIERLLQAVFVAFLKCPSVTIASGEFAIQDHLSLTLKGWGTLKSPYVLSLWTAMLWKSHENVIKNPRKHLSGPWIQIFHFNGLFFRPWIFCETDWVDNEFQGSWNCHEISGTRVHD